MPTVPTGEDGDTVGFDLTEDFPDAHLHLWDLSSEDNAPFLDVAETPIRPFCGVVGVCPDVTEPQSVLPRLVDASNRVVSAYLPKASMGTS